MCSGAKCVHVFGLLTDECFNVEVTHGRQAFSVTSLLWYDNLFTIMNYAVCCDLGKLDNNFENIKVNTGTRSALRS